jgi:hypothetical protein
VLGKKDTESQKRVERFSDRQEKHHGERDTDSETQGMSGAVGQVR